MVTEHSAEIEISKSIQMNMYRVSHLNPCSDSGSLKYLPCFLLFS